MKTAEPGARELWRVIEPYHQLSYRSAEGVERLEAVGLDRPDLRYFGSRLCALGPVSAALGGALCHAFAPSFVEPALPLAWQRAAPARVAEARLEGADLTLRRVLGDGLTAASDIVVAARRAAEACATDVRPMAAAHLEQTWPVEPHLQLWWAATILREHRGDGHWAATAAQGIDAVECHVLASANGYLPADMLRRHTGWSETEWREATARLVDRGLVLDEATATPAGRDLKDDVEHTTDRLAERPLRVLSTEERTDLAAVLGRLSRRVLASGEAAPWRLREEMWQEPSPR